MATVRAEAKQAAKEAVAAIRAKEKVAEDEFGACFFRGTRT